MQWGGIVGGVEFVWQQQGAPIKTLTLSLNLDWLVDEERLVF